MAQWFPATQRYLPMPTLRTLLPRFAVLCSFAAAPWAYGQADPGTLLNGKSVTESNVLDALTPPSAVPEGPDDDSSVRTRGFRPTIRKSDSEASLKYKKKPTASLLITFQTDSDFLTQRSKEQLDIVAGALKNDRLKGFNFDIEGHADLRGQVEGNRALSQQRAEVVRKYLIEAHGILEARLRAVGKGDSEPMNSRDIAAPENRRVAFTTIAPSKPLP